MNSHERNIVAMFEQENGYLMSEFQAEVIALCEHRGKVNAITQIAMALGHEHGGQEEAMKVAVQLLSRGADDSWSGRRNDMARAFHDGVRKVAARAIDDFFYGDIEIKNLHRV